MTSDCHDIDDRDRDAARRSPFARRPPGFGYRPPRTRRGKPLAPSAQKFNLSFIARRLPGPAIVGPTAQLARTSALLPPRFRAVAVAPVLVGRTRIPAPPLAVGDPAPRGWNLRLRCGSFGVMATGSFSGHTFAKSGERLFCLLEDDWLISRFSVEAVRSPYSPVEYVVRIRATVRRTDGTHDGLGSFR